MQTVTTSFGVTKKQDKRGEVLLEYLYSCDLSWANRGSKPTFVNSRGHSSVIDLTLTNNKGSDLINSWRVSDLISNSDHNYITFNINVESKSTNITYNPTKTNWEKFEDFVCNSSRCEYIKKLEITNEEDMDIAAQELITLINEAMIASCPSTYITSTFKRPPWMTREVDEARANIRHRLKRVKKSKTRNNWNTYHSELKDYKKLFKKAKSDSWKEFCKNTESTSDIARVHNILKVTGSKPTKLDTIYKSKNTKTLTDSPNETLDVMIKHHFTGVSADAPQDVNQQVNKIKPPNELIKKIINEDCLGKVISEMDSLKAAGPDQVQSILIQKAYKHIKNPLIKIYRQSYITGIVYITRISSQLAKASFAAILVTYTTTLMKQYHFNHFYVNLDFYYFS